MNLPSMLFQGFKEFYYNHLLSFNVILIEVELYRKQAYIKVNKSKIG